DLGNLPPVENSVRSDPSDELSLIAGELAEKYAVEALAVSLDVTDNESIARALETITRRFPRIDVLCNNAGASFGVPNTVVSYDEAAWIKTLEVNLLGVFRVSRAVIPLMLGKTASIINNASRAGKVPPIFNSAYAVAKAGVIMLTKTMAKELAGAGIRVNAICPGQIRTDLSRWRFELEAKFFNTTPEEREREMCKSIPLGYIGDITDAGNLVAFLASDESRYITGQAINLDGGQCMEL
ncbi:MAG: SDR family NAD(P)-dependent oxidoreductase, partial [Smithellaceae bacterium]|nr:SDR family NAD(P)-dependent oxidoreductase [Smithellaceae bacterium]